MVFKFLDEEQTIPDFDAYFNLPDEQCIEALYELKAAGREDVLQALVVEQNRREQAEADRIREVNYYLEQARQADENIAKLQEQKLIVQAYRQQLREEFKEEVNAFVDGLPRCAPLQEQVAQPRRQRKSSCTIL